MAVVALPYRPCSWLYINPSHEAFRIACEPERAQVVILQEAGGRRQEMIGEICPERYREIREGRGGSLEGEALIFGSDMAASLRCTSESTRPKRNISSDSRLVHLRTLKEGGLSICRSYLTLPFPKDSEIAS